MDLAKTHYNIATLEPPRKAIDSCRRAIATWAEVPAGRSEGLKEKGLGLIHGHLAGLYAQLHDDPSAEGSYRSARRHLEDAVADAPHSVDRRKLLIATHGGFANWLAERQRHREAEQEWQAARPHLRHLLQQTPDDWQVHKVSAEHWLELGRLQSVLGLTDAAKSAITHAQDDAARLRELRPNDEGVQILVEAIESARTMDGRQVR
jgi:hypothetical protein